MSNLKSFKDLVRLAPKELQQVFWKQWKAPQNPNFHPEGNTLKHIAVVVSRAIKNHPNDINIILSAFFHDLGKFFTLDFKNNQPTAHGHEKVSVEFVDKYSEWILSLGGDPEKIKYVVENHMRIKPNVWDVMKQSKKDKITQNPNYNDLSDFGKLDKGGLHEIINKMIDEEFNRAEYHKWKRKNVSYRGMQNVGQENGGSAILGNGLYSAALSNKSMAKGYGDLYFAVGAVPKNPKVFNTLNEWQIWFYNKLVIPYSQAKAGKFPDKRDFFANTTIEDEVMKLGYDGVVIKGREMVNYKPEDVKYYKTEQGIIDHYYHYIAPEGLNEVDQPQNLNKVWYHGTRTPLPFDRFDAKLDGSGLVSSGGQKFGGFFFTDSKENAEYYTEYFIGTTKIENLEPNPYPELTAPAQVLKKGIVDQKNYIINDTLDGAICSDIAVVPMSNLKDVQITGWEFVGEQESYFETLDRIFGGDEEDNYVDQDMIVETLSIIEMNINSMLNIPIFKQYYDSKG